MIDYVLTFPLYILVALLYEEPGNFASGQSGEIMTQDQFTRQISLQVKQSITEELELFRQEQAQILRDAMKEVLPEMELRIIENISTKLDASKETTTPESDSGSGKQSPGFPRQMSPRWTPHDLHVAYTFSDAIKLHDIEEPDTVGRKQTTGFLPIKPSVGKKLYTKKSHGDSWKQTPDLAICSSWSEGSHSVSY